MKCSLVLLVCALVACGPTIQKHPKKIRVSVDTVTVDTIGLMVGVIPATTATPKRVQEIVLENPGYTDRQIADELHAKTTGGVLRTLRKLKADGVVESRDRHWYIREDTPAIKLYEAARLLRREYRRLGMTTECQFMEHEEDRWRKRMMLEDGSVWRNRPTVGDGDGAHHIAERPYPEKLEEP